MVVCPWCGTNYAAFQSNCSKCGGPIQAVQAVTALLREPELVMPPPLRAKLPIITAGIRHPTSTPVTLLRI